MYSHNYCVSNVVLSYSLFSFFTVFLVFFQGLDEDENENEKKKGKKTAKQSINFIFYVIISAYPVP